MTLTALKVYFSHPINSMSEEYINAMHNISTQLSEVGFEILPYADKIKKKLSDSDIYHYDMAQIAACDLLVCIVDKGSTGVGMEIKEALHIGKSVIAFHLNQSHVSPMVTGMKHPKYDCISIVDYHQIPAILKSMNH